MRGTCFCVLALALLAVGGTLLGGDAKEAGENDLKKLQGTWQFVSHEVTGKPTPPEQLKKMKITFSGDNWSVREDGNVIQQGMQTLDPTKKPAQVDMSVTEGEDKGSTMVGIYELKGDIFKVCFDLQGKERPTSFTPKAGQLAAVIQREKKKTWRSVLPCQIVCVRDNNARA
jgi:uncharacterized protein (TIGR03067 family)